MSDGGVCRTASDTPGLLIKVADKIRRIYLQILSSTTKLLVKYTKY